MSSLTGRIARAFVAADREIRQHNVTQARQHLASMTPERRAMLEAEWDVPISDGRRTGPEAL